MLRSIKLSHWRQFDCVAVDFHPRLTVLTGANGAGKTTILHLLNRHWGWDIPYASTPRFTRSGIRRYWAGFWQEGDSKTDSEDAEASGPQSEIGSIEYSEAAPAVISVPASVPETFSPQIEPLQKLPGVYVSSHRPLYIHQPIEQIPTKVDAREQIFAGYLNELRSRWIVGKRVQSPSHKLKASLISLAVFGYGNEAVVPSREARETLEGFEHVLRIILPRTLGFRHLKIQTPDILLVTDTGGFSLDAASGGVSALIDIAWQVFLYSLLNSRFVVVIDEPEAHLHPQLQKDLLPSLLEAFPTAQFVVATHNPFVVGSVPDSNVYVLHYSDRKRVNSVLLGEINKAGTSNEILRDVLGLESASPAWVEKRFTEIIERHAGTPLSGSKIETLRSELEEIGLGRYIPQAIDRLIGD